MPLVCRTSALTARSVRWQPQIFYICQPYFLLHIYDPLSIPCLAVIFVFTVMKVSLILVWQTYLLFFINTSNFWNCTHNCLYKILMLWSVRWQPQIFYICQPYFLLHIYDPLSIPCLAVIFVFTVMKVSLQFINSLHLAAIFVFFSDQWQLMNSSFGRHISFYLCQ